MERDYQTLLSYITLVAQAHQEKTNEFGVTRRPGGGKNFYFTHPLWCCMMMLLEPTLPDDIRLPGALALLFHDVLEDTTVPLPDTLPPEVKELVAKLTVAKEAKYNYSSWEKEKRTITHKPPLIQLLKLYDKVSSLYDASVKEERYQEWVRIVEEMTTTVEKTYGTLRIVLMARSITTYYREHYHLETTR